MSLQAIGVTIALVAFVLMIIMLVNEWDQRL